MKILGISSVTRDCGIAIVQGKEAIGNLSLSEGRGLSESLMPAIGELLRNVGVTVDTLDGIAVTAGPGSFTGIKVGLAAAKGLALAHSIKTAGVSTLEALAWSVGPRGYPIYAIINAGRGEVFAGCYLHSANRLEQRMPDGLFSPEEIAALITGPSFLVGEAAPMIDSLIRSTRQGTKTLLLPEDLGTPLAVAVAQAGIARVAGDSSGTAAFLTPLYIRRAEAEVQLEKKRSLSIIPA